MKRNNLWRVLVCSLAVSFLCACGSPEDAVENFYDALYDGDFDAAQSYCSDDAAAALEPLIKIADENPEAMDLWKHDAAFERKFFRLLTEDEIKYQQNEDEKQKNADAKQKKEQRKNLSKEEFEAFEKIEKAELDALKGAQIVYTRWSKGLVFKHYLQRNFWGRWEIVKIENGHALPERIMKGN